MEFPTAPQADTTVPQKEPQKEQKNAFKDKIYAFFDWLWTFIKSPVFLKNLGVLIVFLILSFLILSYGLKIATKHNKSVQVENYKGLDIEAAKRKARSRGFLVTTLHAPGSPGEIPNQVFQQFPAPDAKVKSGRTVYLSIHGSEMPPEKIPTFLGNDSYSIYKGLLISKKLRVSVEEQFDAKLQKNTVVAIWYKGEKYTGSDLKKGTGVTARQGDTIKCIITTRFSPTVAIPKLVCLDYKAAQFSLSSSQLTVGQIHGDFMDKNTAFVWKQVPAFVPRQQITKGKSIELYLRDDRPESCN